MMPSGRRPLLKQHPRGQQDRWPPPEVGGFAGLPPPARAGSRDSGSQHTSPAARSGRRIHRPASLT